MTFVKFAALALVVMLAVGCSAAAPGTPKPSPSLSPLPPPVCTTNKAKGTCGPYDHYPYITGTTSSTSVGQDVWNPIAGWVQRLSVENPGDWHATANMPAGNSAVVSMPSVSANFGQTTNLPTPLSDFVSVHSSFAEDMHATSKTSADAAYDIWLGRNSSTWSNEVMIQHDIINRGTCPTLVTATFGGSGGVPVQKWNLCKYNTELIWQLAGTGERSGSVDILAMLTWLEAHGYLPRGSGLWQIDYGFELCSTGGVDETFQVSSYSITSTPSSSASPSSSSS